MDADSRVEAVKARLRDQRAVLVSAKEAGPACERCSFHFRKAGKHSTVPVLMCGNPVYTSSSFDAASGRYSETGGAAASEARSPEGLCGPEAALFEPWPFDRSLLALGAVICGVVAVAAFGFDLVTSF